MKEEEQYDVDHDMADFTFPDQEERAYVDEPSDVVDELDKSFLAVASMVMLIPLLFFVSLSAHLGQAKIGGFIAGLCILLLPQAFLSWRFYKAGRLKLPNGWILEGRTLRDYLILGLFINIVLQVWYAFA